jgi:hypothetical protein
MGTRKRGPRQSAAAGSGRDPFDVRGVLPARSPDGLLLPAVICGAWLVAPVGASADAPAQLSGAYAVTGLQIESATPAGSNLKIVVDEHGTFDGGIQGNWAWEPSGAALANGSFGTSQGNAVCSPCTVEGRTGSFTAVEGSGAGQPSIRFTITAAYGGLAGLHGDLITTGGATGTYIASVSFT